MDRATCHRIQHGCRESAVDAAKWIEMPLVGTCRHFHMPNIDRCKRHGIVSAIDARANWPAAAARSNSRPVISRGLIVSPMLHSDEKRSEDDFSEFFQRHVTLLHPHPQQGAFPTVQEELSEQRCWQLIADCTYGLCFGNALCKEAAPGPEMHGEPVAN